MRRWEVERSNGLIHDLGFTPRATRCRRVAAVERSNGLIHPDRNGVRAPAVRVQVGTVMPVFCAHSETKINFWKNNYVLTGYPFLIESYTQNDVGAFTKSVKRRILCIEQPECRATLLCRQPSRRRDVVRNEESQMLAPNPPRNAGSVPPIRCESRRLPRMIAKRRTAECGSRPKLICWIRVW